MTPAPLGSRRGNRITGERWGNLLAQLGYAVDIVEFYNDELFDVLIVLHAAHGADSIRRYRQLLPQRPVIVAITGTDIYGDHFERGIVAESLAAADRIVVLQGRTVEDVPEDRRAKVRVILQSAAPPPRREAQRSDVFEIAAVGHLRPVKDPFRAAEAARLLSPESTIRILHLGEAIAEEVAERARHEAATNPRYMWLGDRPREEALAVMSRCRLVVLTSLSEGGPAVISEAIVMGVPVLSSRVAGCVGMLGEDYPGLFPVGDTQALAELFHRAERDAAFYSALRAACDRLRPLFRVEAEMAAWRSLLEEI